MKRKLILLVAALGLLSVPSVASAHWQSRDVKTAYITYAVHYPPTYYPTITTFQSYGPPSGYLIDVLNQLTGIGQCSTYFPPKPIGERWYMNCFGSVGIEHRRIRVAATATPVPYWIGVFVADHLTY